MQLFRFGFLTITIIDAIDVVLVAVIFYFVYRSLRATVAVQILLGMVLLLGTSFLVNSANMRGLSWIINTLSSIWLLAFIVLFQPELRRVMSSIAQSRFFRLFIRTNITETVDEVIDAVKEMSEKHIGALIIFSRTQNVRVTVDTGIPLQATITSELLQSIFNPRSPLHDGAVVIDNELIVAARCVLPLSSAKKAHGKNLGTRHRAAIGISEQTDVIALIVSEETGAISLAHYGEITTSLPFSELRSELLLRLRQESTLKETLVPISTK